MRELKSSERTSAVSCRRHDIGYPGRLVTVQPTSGSITAARLISREGITDRIEREREQLIWKIQRKRERERKRKTETIQRNKERWSAGVQREIAESRKV